MNTYLLIMLTEIRKDKIKLIKDPIKRMSYKGSGSAREVVRMIALALGLKIHEDEYGISAYGGNAIRIADHCTYMQTWVDRGTWNAPIRLDVVIEEEPTQAVTQVKNGYDFTIVEFVYDITDVDTQNARTIAYDIRNVINGNQYANNARGKRRTLKSTHNSNENKQYNKNTNMKQTIKLRESELKRMIVETIRSVVNEIKMDGKSTNNYDEWQNMAQQLTIPLKLRKPQKYKEIVSCLKDYIDNEREDLKMAYEEFCNDIHMTCQTWESNGHTYYCEKDDTNNAHQLPSMYQYCISQIKNGH